uniref:Uncharacterized protein n=1 Tax=Melicertus latisulcatus pemonivirus TaxID=2984278 RepID=A0A9C7BVY0_9VIRU|nr:MAG: hypothetical protein [Melicertus latisulcatus pemonivirus]
MAPFSPTTSMRESLEWHPSTVSSKHYLYSVMAHSRFQTSRSRVPQMRGVQVEREDEGDSYHIQCIHTMCHCASMDASFYCGTHCQEHRFASSSIFLHF